MRLAALIAAIACFGCSSGVARLTASNPPAHLLLYLPVNPVAAVPPAGEAGVSNWAVQMNQFDAQYSFIIYERRYAGSFALETSCDAGKPPSASAQFAQGDRGPGAILVVTSASALTSSTCIFTVQDAFGQSVALSAGFAG